MASMKHCIIRGAVLRTASREQVAGATDGATIGAAVAPRVLFSEAMRLTMVGQLYIPPNNDFKKKRTLNPMSNAMA